MAEEILAVAAKAMAEAVGKQLGEAIGKSLADAIFGDGEVDAFSTEVAVRLREIELKVDYVINLLERFIPRVIDRALLQQKINEAAAHRITCQGQLGAFLADKRAHHQALADYAIRVVEDGAIIGIDKPEHFQLVVEAFVLFACAYSHLVRYNGTYKPMLVSWAKDYIKLIEPLVADPAEAMQTGAFSYRASLVEAQKRLETARAARANPQLHGTKFLFAAQGPNPVSVDGIHSSDNWACFAGTLLPNDAGLYTGRQDGPAVLNLKVGEAPQMYSAAMLGWTPIDWCEVELFQNGDRDHANNIFATISTRANTFAQETTYLPATIAELNRTVESIEAFLAACRVYATL